MYIHTKLCNKKPWFLFLGTSFIAWWFQFNFKQSLSSSQIKNVS
jgi:hypothetical protein